MSASTTVRDYRPVYLGDDVACNQGDDGGRALEIVEIEGRHETAIEAVSRALEREGAGREGDSVAGVRDVEAALAILAGWVSPGGRAFVHDGAGGVWGSISALHGCASLS